MSGVIDYVRDGAAIYARSFAIIRAEARLDRFAHAEERVAVRIIHACGMVEVADDIVFAPGASRSRKPPFWQARLSSATRNGGAWRNARAASRA